MHAPSPPRESVIVVCAVLAALLLPAAPARAADVGIDLRLGMSGGGDTLVEVGYSDGSDSKLRLGTWFYFAGGPVFTPVQSGPHSLKLAALVGVGGWNTGPEYTEDRIGLTRLPLEFLAYYDFRPETGPMGVRVGCGLTYHLIGGAKGSGALEGWDYDIDNALGGVGEVSLTFDMVHVGVRYTSMTYVVEGVDMDASSIGGVLGFTFPI